MIQLKEITKENYRACMNLKTTKEQLVLNVRGDL